MRIIALILIALTLSACGTVRQPFHTITPEERNWNTGR